LHIFSLFFVCKHILSFYYVKDKKDINRNSIYKRPSRIERYSIENCINVQYINIGM